jgi:hypothetical protein
MNMYEEKLSDYVSTLSAVKDANLFGLVLISKENKSKVVSWLESHGYIVSDNYTDDADRAYLSEKVLENSAKNLPRTIEHSHIFVLSDEEYRNITQTDAFGPVCDLIQPSV